MSNIVYDYIDDYITELLPESGGLLREMEDFAAANHVPIIRGETAKFLSFIIRCKKAKSILEIGTAIGYSAIYMHCAAGGCRITTLERDPGMIAAARENIARAGLGDDIEVVPGEADEVLSGLSGSFDLIFLDGAKGQYLKIFPDCDRMLKRGGIIFADNVLFRGMVANRALLVRRKITIVKRMKKYLEFMFANSDYDTSLLPLGDGVAVSLKLEDKHEED